MKNQVPSKEQIEKMIEAQIAAGMMERAEDGGYRLTAMGTAYVEHMLKTNPGARDVFDRLAAADED